MPNTSQALNQAALPVAATVVAIVVLAVAIYLIRSWLRDNDGPAASYHELLGEYQDLNQQGELSDEEFRIIKSRMASRIGRTSDSMRSSEGKG